MTRFITALLALLFSATLALAQEPVSLGPQADLIMVYKSSRKMVLFNNEIPLATYRIDLGFAPSGDKNQSGDGRTPEGTYYIDRRNPDSRFHLSLGLSYPNTEDIAEAAARGVDPGGDIFIHGGPRSFWQNFVQDWTAGCISVNNREIEQIWNMVPLGTPIVIVP